MLLRQKLREIVTDDENREVLEELIRRLNILRNRYVQESISE